MNEAETRAEHIDPALKAAGWGVVEGSRIRREYPITPVDDQKVIVGQLDVHLEAAVASNPSTSASSPRSTS